jgi:FAD/FMN-containing dehydrogenase
MAVQHGTIEQLQATHRGAIITPTDSRYEEGRRVWNAMIDRRPAVIVRCRSAADVMTAVRYGRDNQLPIAVRGGAHGIAGMGTCNDGLVIDFADMKGIRVNRKARTVRAEPGLRWTEFDRETQAFGLATTGGTIGDTGIAGLTLGGGFGWLEGRFGMTVDNVVSADLVLASGELVHASDKENSDLFWAIRGGGGNFGVVTSFEYQLHQVGPMIVGGLVIHPFSAATDLLRYYRDLLRDAPDELTPAAVLLTLPDGNKGCAIAVAYSGAVPDGERIVRSIKSFGRPVMDAMGPIPYLGQQSMLEQAMPPNLRNYWKADFVATVSDEVIETAVTGYAKAISPLASILFFPIHGAAARKAKDATAYPHRGGIHMGIYSLWNDPAQDAQNVQWVRRIWDAIQPHIPGGVYVNELGEDEGNDRVRQAYGANYNRLAQIKGKYDPGNLFRLNANIVPA